jgi:hypothetical protein
VSNKDVKQDALDNLADALTEDILNTPDDELLREVEEDYGDPRALANKFDQILERAEKQVFGTARSAASPQVRSSVLDLLISLLDETIRWVKGIFDLGRRVSEFLSSLTPRTLAWSATAAAVVILVQAAVITAVLVKEQGASSGSSVAAFDPRAPPMAALPPDVPVQSAAAPPRKQSLSDEEIAALVAGGRQLMVAGDIPNARLVLQQAAEADNATAALELGATYDPTILQQLKAAGQTKTVRQAGQTKTVRQTESHGVESVPAMTDMGDIRMARLWYEKARDLGSTEAARRLEGLAGWKSGPR